MPARRDRPRAPFEAANVTDVLLYQTSDLEFADDALGALEAARISSFKTGTAWRGLWYGIGLNSISIFIRHPEDYQRANAVLVGIGAVVEEPSHFLRRPLAWILIVAAIALSAWVGLHSQ